MFRSEPMQHGTLIIPTEKANNIVRMIGSKGYIMLNDMNEKTMSRPYREFIQRIEEIERRLRSMTNEIQKFSKYKIITSNITGYLDNNNFVLDGVESSLVTLSEQFDMFKNNNDILKNERIKAINELAVVKVASKYLVNQKSTSTSEQSQANAAVLSKITNAEYLPISNKIQSSFFTSYFNNIAGVLLQSDVSRLIKSLFRVTKGNAFIYIEKIPTELAQKYIELENQNVIIIYFQGDDSSTLYNKILHVCTAYEIKLCKWPKSYNDAINRIAILTDLLDEKTKALLAFETFFSDEISVLLEPIYPGGNSLIEEWRLFCAQEKSIYATLNLFEETETTLRATCWYPAIYENKIKNDLKASSRGSNVSAFLLTDENASGIAPTWIRVSKFTECFQNMVDTYGVPMYREANPALCSIITFPFLFGLMFGDIGHGIVLTIFGAYLLYNNNKKSRDTNEIVSMLYFGRYMIFMMGVCSIYCGMIYNDFFAMSLNLFGTRYKLNDNSNTYSINNSTNFPYPFGIDPIWKLASNELDFENSFKMKMSVIIGFVHMMLGILHKGINASHFRDKLTFFFEFIPQLIFMTCFVGYMDFVIFVKWFQKYTGQPRLSIISVIIGMAMFKKTNSDEVYYASQNTVERILITIMLICIPVMLFFKPLTKLYQYKAAKHTIKAPQKKKKAELEESLITNMQTMKTELITEINVTHTINFGEELIFQLIETIEFVLGSISNTASYLRLWALSLAHQQLSTVFLEQIFLNVINACIKKNMTTVQYIVAVIGVTLSFFAFSLITIAIMLCMDTLECYLHTLRLHWVEFQNKFYHGDGYAFIPFEFKHILINSLKSTQK